MDDGDQFVTIDWFGQIIVGASGQSLRALVEGVLGNFPNVRDEIVIERVAFPRPRTEVVELVGPDWQGLPMLVMDKDRAPGDAIIVGEYAILQDVRAIGRALTSRYGGVGPHP